MQSPIKRINYISTSTPQRSTRSAQKNHQSRTLLSTLLSCPICQQKIRQSHMCPHCSKLFCQNCIKNWVVTKKPQCPNCMHSLRLTLIVNCTQLGRQLEEAITIMNREGRETIDPAEELKEGRLVQKNSGQILSSSLLCKEHQIKLEYYCETCKKGICSDCAVLTETHRHHRLGKLSKKRQSFEQQVEKMFKKIQYLRQTLIRGKLQAQTHIQANKQKQVLQLSQLQSASKRLINEMQKKSLSVIDQRQQSCNRLFRNNVEQITIYDQLLNTLQLSTKSSLIRNYNEIHKEIENEINNKFEVEDRSRREVEGQIIPEYECKIFILDNYTHMKEKKDILYSEAFFWRGIEWRLKIYPGGIQDKKGLDQYLAIYLQMSKGHKDHLNRYKYKIQLINQLNRKQKISKVFESEFEEGLCWGYDTFAKINTLYDEKYVHPKQDYLEIILCVKSPTHYHAVKDLNYIINSKKLQFQANIHRIHQMKSELTSNNTMRNKSNRISVDEPPNELVVDG